MTLEIGGIELIEARRSLVEARVEQLKAAILEAFHADHPNINVYFAPDPENFVEEMASDFVAGTAPDVFQGCCAHFPAWAQAGKFALHSKE